jgi:hypothetical protein
LTDGVAGHRRHVTATVDPGKMRLDEVSVQIVHGPLDPSGALDGTRVETVAMSGDGTGRFTGEFAPSGAGPWGAAVRAMPFHQALSNPIETGLVTLG